MDPEGDQLVEIQVLVTLLLQLRHSFRGAPVNSSGTRFVGVRIVAGLFESENHFRRHAVNAEGDELVAVGNDYTRRANAFDELGRHAMNLESNELVRIQSLQVFGFDIPREFQANIMDGHRPLFVVVDPFETQRLHLLQILRLSREMKQPRALGVPQKPLAFEFSCIPRDRKMNFLPPGLGKIHAGKIARRPVGTVVKVMPGARIHQRELHSPRSIGAPNGPIAALPLAAESFRHAQDDSSNHKDKTDNPLQIHGTSLLSVFPAKLTECPRSSAPSACPASDSGTRASAPSR